MNPRAAILCLLLGLVAGCGKQSSTIKGEAPRGDARTILAVQAGDTPSTVTVPSKLVEKCPIAGCWFRLEDETGVIKVDTKLAGFVVTDVPLQSTVTVGGRVTHEGAETVIQASGLRY